MKNICFAYPNRKLYYSETFVQNQLNMIPHKNELSGGRLPYIDDTGISIFKNFMSINIIRGSVKNFFPKIYQKLFTNALFTFFKEKGTDLLFAQYGPTGASVVDACKQANVELIVHFHGYDASHDKTLSKFSESYLYMAEYAKYIVVVSYDMKNKLTSLGLNNKFEYIPYGIDTSKFNGANPARSEPISIFVGRFTAKKAPHITIKAFSIVLEKIPNAKLLMIGDGELLNESIQIAKDLNIFQNINFMGKRSPEEIASILKTGRLFVQHSVVSPNGDSEGTPNTILEASSTGLPIVSTFHAGIKEAVIHDKTGFLVEEYDIDGMANNMLKLLEDPIMAYKMGLEAQKHIHKNYNLIIQTNKLNALCQKKKK